MKYKNIVVVDRIAVENHNLNLVDDIGLPKDMIHSNISPDFKDKLMNILKKSDDDANVSFVDDEGIKSLLDGNIDKDTAYLYDDMINTYLPGKFKKMSNFIYLSIASYSDDTLNEVVNAIESREK